MALDAKYNFEDLYNAAEELVFRELEDQLANTETTIPRDQDSVVDMAAFALNMVSPMYRANLLGRVYEPALSAEHHREIVKAVSAAIERVSKNPPE